MPRLLLAGIGVLALVGCGGSREPATKAPRPGADEELAAGRPPDDAGQIETLLRNRARALERRVVAAFAGTDGRRRQRFGDHRPDVRRDDRSRAAPHVGHVARRPRGGRGLV